MFICLTKLTIHCYNYSYNFIAFQEAKRKREKCIYIIYYIYIIKMFIILKILLLSYVVLFFPMDLIYHLGHKCNFLSGSYTALFSNLPPPLARTLVLLPLSNHFSWGDTCVLWMAYLMVMLALDQLSLPLMMWNLCPKVWFGAECFQAALSRVVLL